MDSTPSTEAQDPRPEYPQTGFTREDLTVTLTGADGRTYVGLVVNTKEDGQAAKIVADFPSSEAPILTVGRRTDLCFRGGELEAPLPTEARVVFRTGDAFRQRYQFVLPEKDRDRVGLVMNRRNAIRVRPSPESPVPTTLQVEGSETAFDAVLQDVSTTGACLLVTRNLEEDLFSSWSVRVTVQFAGDEEPIALVGRIRYRKLAGFVIRYGVEFDSERTVGFGRCQERIHRYVTTRLAEEVSRLNLAPTAGPVS